MKDETRFEQHSALSIAAFFTENEVANMKKEAGLDASPKFEGCLTIVPTLIEIYVHWNLSSFVIGDPLLYGRAQVNMCCLLILLPLG